MGLKGALFSIKRVPFLSKWYIKGKGLDLGGSLSVFNFVKYPPGGPVCEFWANTLLRKQFRPPKTSDEEEKCLVSPWSALFRGN